MANPSLEETFSFMLARQPAGSFTDLVAMLPDSAFKTPQRSTVALLDYWRNPGRRIEELGTTLGMDLASPVSLAFEHTVPARIGVGKPSYTDLMVLASNASIAVEAKFTEPRYPSIEDWLAKGPLSNRIDVLRGWLYLIEVAAGRPIRVESLASLPYQLIHRAASACTTDGPVRVLVYHIFGPNAEHYVNDVAALKRALGPDSSLRLCVMTSRAVSLPTHQDLMARWRSQEGTIGDAVRKTLMAQPLFDFEALSVVR